MERRLANFQLIVSLSFSLALLSELPSAGAAAPFINNAPPKAGLVITGLAKPILQVGWGVARRQRPLANHRTSAAPPASLELEEREIRKKI